MSSFPSEAYNIYRRAERTQRRWRAQLKSYVGMRSLMMTRIGLDVSEMPVENQNVGYQCPVEDHFTAEDQSHSEDERAEDKTAGEVVEPLNLLPMTA
ncbi:hypothetical protein V1525DRAFT_390980 [Lipomyces kononenkoae]|uniref:Uncharacterized protein n=1 Tax=Lipomyces kononenkoae TaxID=34357 RepID=A0ACC3SUW1_LIPKO